MVAPRRFRTCGGVFLILILSVLGSTRLMAGPSGSCVPPPSGMVAWWPLDETSGTTVTDIVGGHNGTAQPGPIGAFAGTGPVTSASWPLPTFPVGMVDNSLSFYGNRRIEVPSHSDLEPGNGDFTVDAWLIYAASGNAQFLTIVSKKTIPMPPGTGWWGLWIQDISVGVGWLRLEIAGPATAAVLAISPISPNTWHHVAFTLKRGSPGDIYTLYLDGISVAGPATWPSLGNVANSVNVLIGGDGVSGGEIAVDEVEIFNRALAQPEIQDIFNAQSAGKCKPQCLPPPSGMVAWWPFDETSAATSLQDIIGGNNAAPSASPVGAAQAPQPVSGMVNGAIHFPKFGNGLSGARVSPQGALGTIGSADFTIDAWGKFPPSSAANKPHYVVNKFDSAQNKGYALYIISPGITGNERLEFKWGDGANVSTVQSTSPITSNQWYHMAVTFARNVGSNALDIRLYVDGLQEGQQVGNPPGLGSLVNFVFLEIGWQPGTIDEPITLDELEIFDRALTQQEIHDIFGAGSAGKCKPTADLGDAPDGTNHAGAPMTAYTSVPANFPTVYDPVLGAPYGPIHLNPKGLAWLGTDVSFEEEADIGPDQDPVNNINPVADTADRDNHDDGVILPINLPACGPTQFQYQVTALSAATLYTNVWFDFNRDGDWQDIQKCPLGPAITGLASEWAVQNEPIAVGPGMQTLTTPVFGSFNPSPGGPIWMRITLTDVPISSTNGADGSGPPGGHVFGETEDYKVSTDTPPATILPGAVTQCQALETTCPAVLTACPAVQTQCPAAPTTCPPVQTVCPPVPTTCPPVQTLCPPLETRCPALDATRCPAEETRCPGVETRCPPLATQCPSFKTACPPLQTHCPVVETLCPPLETQCPSFRTACPPEETRCPGVETRCPPLETQCPSFRTACPPFLTNCPAVETRCPSVETKCPEENTRCPPAKTACPPAATLCPPVSTSCPPAATQCPRFLTRCPICVPGDLAFGPTEKPDSVLGAGCPVVETDCPSITEYVATALARQRAKPG